MKERTFSTKLLAAVVFGRGRSSYTRRVCVKRIGVYLGRNLWPTEKGFTLSASDQTRERELQ